MPAKRRHPIPTTRKPLLSIEEAAEMLALSRGTLYRSIKRGDCPLPVFKINGCHRIPRRAIEALVEGHVLPPAQFPPPVMTVFD